MLYGLTEQQVALLQQLINAMREGGFNLTPIGMSSMPAPESRARQVRQFPRMVWVTISSNASGDEMYNGKSFYRDYSTAITSSDDASKTLLGSQPTDDDCLIANMWSLPSIDAHILTFGGTPTKPFLGEWRYSTEDGKMVVFIDGHDPTAC